MIKIVDLGHEFQNTGEKRVSIIDEGLLKVASNDIQDYWAKLDRKPGFAYLHVIAMSDSNKYGPNNNGDWFDGSDLKKDHGNFLTNAHIYLHHVNKDPQKSIGKPIYSFYNDNMHRVELVLEIDKSLPLAKETVSKIRRGEDIFVSMGVNVDHDVCSICGNKAKTRSQYCEHLRYNMRKILPDGRQVYAKNPAPLKFFDISVVHRPADKIAWALDKAASLGYHQDTYFFDKTSAELGEEYTTEQAGLSGIRKLSEIIKRLDGDITAGKDEDGDFSVIRQLKEQKPKHLDYPALSCKDLDGMDASPGLIIKTLLSEGVAPSLGEMAWASGRHHMGHSFREDMIPKMLSALPGILALLERTPGRVFSEVEDLLGDGANEDPTITIRIIKAVRPVAQKRIMLIKQACDEPTLDKLAKEIYPYIPQQASTVSLSEGDGLKRLLVNMARRDISTSGPGMFDTFKVQGPGGREYATNRVTSMIAEDAQDSGDLLFRKFLGSVVGLAALGASVSDLTALQKLVTVPALGLGAAAIFSNRSNGDTIVAQQGIEVPASSTFSAVNTSGIGRSLAKHAEAASVAPRKLPRLTRPGMGALVGMAVPTMLGLDYLYNKHIRYPNHPNPEQGMGITGRTAYRLGAGVTENPVTSLAAAGIAGGLLRSYSRDKKSKALATLRKLR